MFTRGNPLHRYLHSNGSGQVPEEAGAPYALVTGSTGGMGEEWAFQLAALGFNLIIQGRNQKKLSAIAEEIHSRPESKHVDVKLLVTEATIWPNPPLFERLGALMSDDSIRLTIVINNLGINTVDYPPLETQTREDVAEIIIANSMFPTEVTRMTLPKLKKHQPSLTVTISSMAFQNPPPLLVNTYSHTCPISKLTRSVSPLACRLTAAQKDSTSHSADRLPTKWPSRSSR